MCLKNLGLISEIFGFSGGEMVKPEFHAMNFLPGPDLFSYTVSIRCKLLLCMQATSRAEAAFWQETLKCV